MFPPSAWIFLLCWGLMCLYVLLACVIAWRFNRTSVNERGQGDNFDVWSRRPSENVRVFLYIVTGKPADASLRWMTTIARVCLFSVPLLFLVSVAVAFVPPIVAANTR
jgi:hypothetical protein